jgi:hydrogenase maturation protease
LVSKPHTLIVGIGNIFLGDDAFGCEVVKELNRRVWPEDVRIVDFGIRGFDLAYALLEEYEVVILVDATPRGGPPGTLYTIEPDLNEIESIESVGVVDTHGMNPLKVLGMVKSMGGEFQKLLLLGCEPETFGPEEGQMGLSSVVQAAVPQAVSIVERLVEKYHKPEIEFVERRVTS